MESNGRLAANRTVVVNGTSLTLTANAVGGTFQYAFNYTRLPTGCTSANATTLSCRPDRVGNYTPQLTVRELGVNSSNVTVVGPTIEVIAALTSEPQASESDVDLGQKEWINSTTAGGAPGYTYTYTDLPPGCASADVADFPCVSSEAGHFSIKVTVTDAAKESSSAMVAFVVNSALSLKLAPSVGAVDVGVAVDFSAIAAGGDGSYRYDWLGLPAGCANSTTDLVACTPTTTGSLTVSLALEDTLNGTPAVASATVTVPGHPTAAVQVTPASGLAPLTVSFLADPSGGVPPYTSNWVFGDGASANFGNVSHTYSAAGSFTATFWYNDSDGIGGHSVLVVQVSSLPAVELSSSQWNTEVGLTVTLNATATGGPLPYSYRWSGLPNGCTDVNASLLACDPSVSGTFAVTVDVTDAADFTFATSHTLGVVPRLSASGSASPLTACGFPENVSFIATASGGLQPYSYAWQFPDGNTANTASSTRTFSVAPTGLAAVTITDSLGVAARLNVSVPSETACPPPTGPSGSTGGTPVWEWATLGAFIVAAAAIAGILIGRRRPAGPSESEPEAPAAECDEADPAQSRPSYESPPDR